MAKKKKKDKKKKKEKEPEKISSTIEPPDQPPLESTLITTLTAKKGESDAIDNAMEGTKEDDATLQELLAGTTEDDGFFRREKEDKKIQPQLQYDSSESKVMREFLEEGIPLTERKIGRSEIKQRIRLAEPAPPSEPEPTDVSPAESADAPPEESLEEKSSVIEEPSFTQKEPESIYPS